MSGLSEKCIVLCWNVWSILNENKLLNLLQILEDYKISIACIGETWFDAPKGTFSSTIKKNGYQLHHSYREGKRGGGTAILYRSELTVKEGEASSSEYTSFEYSYVFLTMESRRKMLIGCIYRKQEVSYSMFIDEFSCFMDKVACKADVLLMVGDFNVWVDDDNSDSKQLLSLMSAHGLSQIVHVPTHRDGHTLDHVYFNQYQLTAKHQVINETLGLTTDHFPIVIEIPSADTNQKPHTISYRKLKDVDADILKEKLEESYQCLHDSWDKEFHDQYIKFDTISREVVDELAPILTRTVKTNQAAWIDDEYRDNRALRRKYERRWKNNLTEENNYYTFCLPSSRSLPAIKLLMR